MAAISKQKQKLIEMTDYFCKKISKTLSTLFENVLKHKCLHKENKLTFTGIDVKQYSFTVIIDHGLKFSARLLSSTERNKGQYFFLFFLVFHSLFSVLISRFL